MLPASKRPYQKEIKVKLTLEVHGLLMKKAMNKYNSRKAMRRYIQDLVKKDLGM